MTDEKLQVTKGRPAMKDVAKAAGVSVAAVSKVIRNAYGVSPRMKAKVESAIAELGYRPSLAARALRGNTFTIGFEIPQLGNDFFNQVMEGAVAAFSGTPYQLIIVTGGNDYSGEDALNSLIDRQPDGIVAIAPHVPSEWLRNAARQVPMVVLGRHDEAPEWDNVKNDDSMGANAVMSHLLELGHKNILHLTVAGTNALSKDESPHDIRLKVYSETMLKAGLIPRVVMVESSEEAAYATAKNLLSDDTLRPTAVFAGHDTLAMGVLRAIGELGLTTKQVSVAGYDDIYLAGNPFISLTTVNQFGVRMGHLAAKLLMERISGNRTQSKIEVVIPELVVRNSTQPAEISEKTTR
jgi:LacI family transcriptional regulator